jgi:hypothetical protein
MRDDRRHAANSRREWLSRERIRTRLVYAVEAIDGAQLPHIAVIADVRDLERKDHLRSGVG